MRSARQGSGLQERCSGPTLSRKNVKADDELPNYKAFRRKTMGDMDARPPLECIISSASNFDSADFLK